MTDLFYATPRRAKQLVSRVLEAGLVPFLKSSPGMGKSSIMRKIAEEYNLKLVDVRLSTCQPTDLSGLPNFVGDIAQFVPFDMFPIESTPLPINPRTGKQYDGWLIFLDEFNSALKTVQAAAYKLVLDKMVGLLPLHERVMIAAAGNLATDRAIVNPLSTAMQSRVVHINMTLDPQEFIKDIVIGHQWDDRILAYLSMNHDRIHDFRPDHNEDTFCCPRTWEFMNKLIEGREYAFDKTTGKHEMTDDMPLFTGTITSGVAVEFVTFTKVFHEIPQLWQIQKDPTGMEIPRDNALRYATILYLVGQANEETLKDITDYINRFTSEMRVLFFRCLMIRKPDLRSEPAFTKALLELSKYLHD